MEGVVYELRLGEIIVWGNWATACGADVGEKSEGRLSKVGIYPEEIRIRLMGIHKIQHYSPHMEDFK